MRKVIIVIPILIIGFLIYKGYDYKKIEYIKDNYLKDKLKYNILTISKINLKEIVEEETIESNKISEVVMFKEFGRPNKEYTNTILGAHSGIGTKAKFKDLDKLSIGDNLKFYYEKKEYNYEAIDKFFVHEKDLTILNSVKNKSTLTLITCNDSNDDYRLIVVFELIDFI